MIKLGASLGKEVFTQSSKAIKEPKTGSSNFNEVMNQSQMGNVNDVVKKLTGETDIAPKSENFTAMRSAPIDGLKATDPNQPTTMQAKINEVVGGVNDEYGKLNRIMDLVYSGHNFSPSELLALQAGVYSIIQEMEMVSKVTQEATSGIRQTLNTNLS